MGFKQLRVKQETKIANSSRTGIATATWPKHGRAKVFTSQQEYGTLVVGGKRYHFLFIYWFNFFLMPLLLLSYKFSHALS